MPQRNIENEFSYIKNIVFTSQHAVRIFCSSEFIHHIPQVAHKFATTLNVFSTSGETKEALKSHNLTPTLSAPTAKQLAHLLLKKADLSAGVHFVCGNLSLNHLPDILEKQGILVKKIAVYETQKHPLSILEPFDAVVFLSLSAADAFLEKNTILPNTQIFTLGETTADHVRKITPTKSIFVAEKPTISALIDLIRQKCT